MTCGACKMIDEVILYVLLIIWIAGSVANRGEMGDWHLMLF